MKLVVGSHTDVGQVREGNEDSFLADAPLFAVADGMGGHLAGDVASATAVEVLHGRAGDMAVSDPETLAVTLRDANRAIWDKALNDPALSGMGTTCTMVLIDGNTAQVAHVGDSRAYLFRDGQLSQLTEDHTLVGRMVREGKLAPEDAERHPQRSIITRALGVDENVDVDVFSLDLAEGDRLLLCSDGLNSMVDATAITATLAGEDDPQRAAETLVAGANEAGGEDNITVVVVDVRDDASAAAPPPPEQTTGAGERAHTDPAADGGYHRAVEVTPQRRRWPRIAVVALVIVALLGGGAVLAARYALDNSWFVGVDEAGVVTIYRGIPYEVAGVTLKEPHEKSRIELDSLPTFKRDDVEAGIRVTSLQDAKDTLEGLERIASDREFQDGRTRKRGS